MSTSDLDLQNQCNHCGKILTDKYKLAKHLTICKVLDSTETTIL